MRRRELDGQPIEQWLVGREFALGAEVARALNDGIAEIERIEQVAESALVVPPVSLELATPAFTARQSINVSMLPSRAAARSSTRDTR